MKVLFADGVNGRVVALSKSANYRLGFCTEPSDPVVELLGLAQEFIPVGWPQSGGLVFVGDTANLGQMMSARSLPAVMVVAEFVGYSHGVGGDLKTTFRRFVWLQSSLDEDISAENLELLTKLSFVRK